jgi:hypothetical protein
MKMRKLSLSVAGLLVCYSNAVADQIIVDFTGDVYSVGSALSSDGVAAGDTVNGQIAYNPYAIPYYDLVLGDGFTRYSYFTGDSFDISIESPSGNIFEVSSPSVDISIQNDQQNGSATLPADAAYFWGSPGSSGTLNGRSPTGWHFGLSRENDLGHLWVDTAPPDLFDWFAITLADINAPDWHWMQFDRSDSDDSIFDSQIRWDITSTDIYLEAPGGEDPEIPEPATMALLGLGLAGFAARSRKPRSA